MPGSDEPGESGAANGPDCHGLPQPTGGSGGGGGAAMGFAGTAQEGRVLRPLLALAMARPVEGVPPIASLLVGPVARGTAVGVR